MDGAIAVHIAAVEDDLDRSPAHRPPAQPDERTEPSRELAEVEQLPRREGIEIPGQDVEAVLMLRDGFQQRAQFDHAPAFGPRGMHRTQVHAEDPRFASGQLNLEKRVA